MARGGIRPGKSGSLSAGVYVGRAEVADLQAGERQRLFWQEGESGREKSGSLSASVYVRGRFWGCVFILKCYPVRPEINY